MLESLADEVAANAVHWTHLRVAQRGISCFANDLLAIESGYGG